MLLPTCGSGFNRDAHGWLIESEELSIAVGVRKHLLPGYLSQNDLGTVAIGQKRSFMCTLTRVFASRPAAMGPNLHSTTHSPIAMRESIARFTSPPTFSKFTRTPSDVAALFSPLGCNRPTPAARSPAISKSPRPRV
jgi:hypothetical protein